MMLCTLYLQISNISAQTIIKARGPKCEIRKSGGGYLEDITHARSGGGKEESGARHSLGCPRDRAQQKESDSFEVIKTARKGGRGARGSSSGGGSSGSGGGVASRRSSRVVPLRRLARFFGGRRSAIFSRRRASEHTETDLARKSLTFIYITQTC